MDGILRVKQALGKRVYREIFERSNLGLAVINSAGVCLKANTAFFRIFGSSADHLSVNSRFLEMLNLPPAGFLRLLASPKIDLQFRHAPCHSATGERLYLSYSIKKTSHLIMCQVEDTTREKLEAGVTKEQQRFMEIGEQTARIVHALKGASTALNHTLEVLSESPDNFPVYLPNLQRIGNRVGDVISQVLHTDSLRTIQFSEVDLLTLSRAVSQLPEIAARLQQAGIELAIMGKVPIIEGVRDDLKEMFVCLIENAIDAILEKGDSGGRIVIRLREIFKGGAESVEVRVEDNGCGIPADKVAMVFKPFFTTKANGSGIGLSVVNKVITETHKGEVSVSSDPGHGTGFRFIFPRYQDKETATSEPLDTARKIELVRRRLAVLGDEKSELVEACTESMTLEHIRESDLDELQAQITGQIGRLEEYLETGRPHVSVNNFSRRTEVVLACDKDSASRSYWEGVILHELQKLGIEEHISVAGTRIISKDRAVCRVFEIKKFRVKLCDEKRARLEAVLGEKFTPLPSLAELETQALFLENAAKLMKQAPRFLGAHSIIFNPAVDGKLRMVSFKVSHLTQIDPLIEEAAARRFLMERITPDMVESLLLAPQREKGGVYLLNEVLDPAMLAPFTTATFLTGVVAALGIRAVLAATFTTPRSGSIINLAYSAQPEIFSRELAEQFLLLNQRWEKGQEK